MKEKDERRRMKGADKRTRMRRGQGCGREG
jgi:hypothetical protein